MTYTLFVDAKDESFGTTSSARRNTVGYGMNKKEFIFNENDNKPKNKLQLKSWKSNFDTLLLSALAHYFQYDTSYVFLYHSV